MDPNSTVSLVDKIMQNPQNWISFLTLIFTIIISFVTLLSIILGFFTSKRYLELREEHLSVKKNIQEEKQKLKSTREEYDCLAKEMDKKLNIMDQKLNIALSGPELERNRELLEACIINLRQDAKLAKKHIDKIIPALYSASESGTIEDVKLLLTILKLSQNRSVTKLASAASEALKRLGLD